MKMNERESCLVTGDTDLYNFEKRLREALHELNLKRVLLEESRKELNQALLVKYELERRLDRACRELEESRVQLELAVSTGRKWEEEREAVPLHRAHLQAAIAERDSLKEEARSLQLEKVKLKRKLEELEGQVHCLTTFQMATNTVQAKAEETIREVKRHISILIQDQKRLELTVKTSSNLSDRLELATRHFNCIHKNMTAKLKKMEENTVLLSSELNKFKTEAKFTAENDKKNQDPQEKFLIEWKTSLQEMESRLKNSEDRSEKLQQALNSALESSEKFWKDAKEREKETKKMKEAKEAIEQELDELKRKKEQKDVEIQVEFSKEENDVPENNTKEDDDSKSKSVSLENRNEEIEKE